MLYDPFIWHSGNGKFIGTEFGSVFARAGDEGEIDYKWAQENFWGEGTVLYLDCGDDYISVCIFQNL